MTQSYFQAIITTCPLLKLELFFCAPASMARRLAGRAGRAGRRHPCYDAVCVHTLLFYTTPVFYSTVCLYCTVQSVHAADAQTCAGVSQERLSGAPHPPST